MQIHYNVYFYILQHTASSVFGFLLVFYLIPILIGNKYIILNYYISASHAATMRLINSWDYLRQCKVSTNVSILY
jgi:hypothetical protein